MDKKQTNSAALHALSAGMDDTYKQNFEKIFPNGKGFDTAKSIVSMIIVAREPLPSQIVKDIVGMTEFQRFIEKLSLIFPIGADGRFRFPDKTMMTWLCNFDRGRLFFISPDSVRQAHRALRDHFENLIRPKTTWKGVGKNAVTENCHYAIKHVVFHQLGSKDNVLAHFEKTLRNPYYVRERLVAGHLLELVKEYAAAERFAPRIVKDWRNFSTRYSEAIKEFPLNCDIFATNFGTPSSWVVKDTRAAWDRPAHGRRSFHPFRWGNIPSKTEPMVVKYSGGGVDCAAWPQLGLVLTADTCCASIWDQQSGSVLHRFAIAAYSVVVELDTDGTPVAWFGDNRGAVSAYDAVKGTLIRTLKLSPIDSTHVTDQSDDDDDDDGDDDDDNDDSDDDDDSDRDDDDSDDGDGDGDDSDDDDYDDESDDEYDESEEDTAGPYVIWVHAFTLDGQDILAAGTGYERKAIAWNCAKDDATIQIFDRTTGKILQYWCTNGSAFDYCYVSAAALIMSSHRRRIQGWSVKGELMVTCKVPSPVTYCVASHPTLPKILAGSNDHCIREYDVMGDRAGECVLTVTDTTSDEWYFGGNWSVCYNHDASVILSTEPQSEKVRIYSRDGSLLHELRGHTDCINKIVCVPITSSGQPTAVARVRSLLLCCLRAQTNGTCSRLSLLYQERAIMLRIYFAVREYESPMILSADRGDGTILWEIPEHLWETSRRFSSPDSEMSDPDQDLLLEEDTFCVSFSDCGRYFGTGSGKAVRLWQSKNRSLLWTRTPEDLAYGSSLVFTPDGSRMIVSGACNILIFDTDNGLISASCRVLGTHNDGHITSMSISPTDGSRLVVTECRNWEPDQSVVVSLDIATPNSIRVLHEISPGARAFSSSFHKDGIRAYVAGRFGGLCFNVETGEILFRAECGCFSVLFVDDFLLYDSDDRFKMKALNQSGTGLEEATTEFLGHSGRVTDQCVTPDGTHVISCSVDATVRVFELQSAKCVYSFFNHRAKQYGAVAVHPKGDFVLAVNHNSMVYILETHVYAS